MEFKYLPEYLSRIFYIHLMILIQPIKDHVHPAFNIHLNVL